MLQKQPQEVFYIKRWLSSQNFAKFTGTYLCQSLFFNKVAGLRPATLLKKRLWHRCFPVNFAKFHRTFFLQNRSGRLLLMLILYIQRKQGGVQVHLILNIFSILRISIVLCKLFFFFLAILVKRCNI